MSKVAFGVVFIVAVLLAVGIYYYINNIAEESALGGQAPEEEGAGEEGIVSNESKAVPEIETERFDDSVGNAGFVNATTTGAMYNATIGEYTFVPRIYGITKGTTVTWRNRDNVTHTVTSDSGVFSSGDLEKDGTFSYTFNEVGRYDYHCNHHSFMKGTFVVN